MDFGIVLLGIVGVVLVFATIYVVSKIASEREAATRRRQLRSIQPFSGDTTTYAGHS
jgi:hypothetical protein